jgi:hypothetical protein
MSHSLEHVEEEANSRFHIQTLLVAVAVDVVALYIFQDEIRLPGRRYTRVH